MKVIKRNGITESFNINKIIEAVAKAVIEVDGSADYDFAKSVGEKVKEKCLSQKVVSVEDIQNYVEEILMESDRKDIARAYVRYRYIKEITRDTNKTYDSILRLLDGSNKELKYENSNKNSDVASTQRDYMAGEVSKDLARRTLLPKDIVEADEAGIIHFHDKDYFAQHIFNCCLINLEDMLQNGTVVNKTRIDKPHSFSTACNIATQIMACVASGQYGGQSISLSHLAPFVNESRKKFKKQVEKELQHLEVTEKEKNELIESITENRVLEDIKRGVQTMQYQINTLNTSNG